MKGSERIFENAIFLNTFYTDLRIRTTLGVVGVGVERGCPKGQSKGWEQQILDFNYFRRMHFDKNKQTKNCTHLSIKVSLGRGRALISPLRARLIRVETESDCAIKQRQSCWLLGSMWANKQPGRVSFWEKWVEIPLTWQERRRNCWFPNSLVLRDLI